ncbi:tyrosine-protein kinase BAZ1B-like [Gigantopelta aegis]|uniref:tyrosine-protein kinase BAZ1B-like n=1 Tax=Gigantopelta aegis TaxID=1735272 RepID=UPI001B888F57|nr:tyrosine-protein kinase BAZ1B-like [Gigantopelta aegis]
MPLLGRKIYSCLKPLNDVKPDETVYTIPHTKEQFRSKAEYEKQLSVYNDKVWTCQCTGHINLTHEEAWNSEKAVLKVVKSQFAKCFEKPVLEIVHHNMLSLDQLVDKAWLTVHQVICVGEKVSLKVKNAGKSIQGVVTQIDSSSTVTNPASNCSSPSSDKENTSEDCKEGSPKKWTLPKLLPYTYTLKLEDDTIIVSVPASDITRNEKLPSKELMRLFIRSTGIRHGVNSSSPWVVNDSYVKKYSLPSKFADLFVSPAKMAEAASRAIEEASKKRKHKKQANGTKAKKMKLDSSSKVSGSDKKKKSNSFVKKMKHAEKSLKKKSPKKEKKSIEIIDLGSSEDSSDEEVLANIKKRLDSDDDTPLYKLASPKKLKHVSNSDSDSDSPLYMLVKSPKKKLSTSKQCTPKKSKGDKMLKKSPSKSGKKTPTKSNKKKGLKQMTLLDIAKKKGMKTPVKNLNKKIRAPSPPRTPPIVKRLLNLHKNNEKVKFGLLVKRAILVLDAKQRAKLPVEIKELVQKKYEIHQEKRMMEKMTPEEKEAFLQMKRKKEKQRQLERLKELRRRFEDQGLNLSPLPIPKPVATPDGLPNEAFGDVAMVTEFISCYGGLLMPEDKYPIHTDALMKALVSGKSGYGYLTRVLVILLQTLLQDQLAEGYSELKVQLSDIPVNNYTVSELVRLCLRKNDTDDCDSEESFEEEDQEVPDGIIELLEQHELFELDPLQKLEVLKGLCLRILGSYSVQDYMEEKQKESSALYRKMQQEQKKKNDELRAEKEKRKEQQQGKEEKEDKSVTKEENANSDDGSKPGLTLTSFYGIQNSNSTTGEGTTNTSVDSEVEGDNLASVVKRRRMMVAQAAVEREKKEKERRLILEKEYEEERKLKEKEKFDEQFKTGITLAKKVLRTSPIGTDRNHCRYWIFNSCTPGLFIEKGRGTPHAGQNLWFTFDSVKDLEKLMSSLHPQGARESALRQEVKKNYDNISKNIIQAQRTNLELRDSDGEVEMLAGFRKELLDTELRLRNGGLGGVPDFAKWEEKILSTKDISELGSCLKDVQAHVLEKFLKGFMKPKVPKAQTTIIHNTEDNVKDEEVYGDEDDEDDKKASSRIAQWRDAIDSCQTLSRLHVLLGMFDSCIKWEKSAENAKCKICRKKSGEDNLLLCDECNQAFHMYCLRPALTYVPKGDWFCPACIPASQRRVRTPRYKESHDYALFEAEEDEEEPEQEKIEHEENCVVCGKDQELLACYTCPSVYHLDCHDPPLRRSPRGVWTCSDCKTGGPTKGTRSRKGKRPQRRAVVKSKYVPETSSDESNNESEKENTEDDITPQRVRRQKKTTKRKSPVKRSRRSNEDSEESFSYSRTNKRAPSELSICEDILARLTKHASSWPFVHPVNKRDVPDYYSVIKHPMDFQTIRQKLMRLSYSSAQEFIKDIALVFKNCSDYNKVDTDVYKCMEQMEKEFMRLLGDSLPFYSYSRNTTSVDDGGRRRGKKT